MTPDVLDRRALVVSAAAFLGSQLAACTRDVAFNYRLTVTVLVDGQRISGGAVRRLRWHERIRFLESLDTSQFLTRGDAAVVDLGRRGVLFATLAPTLYDPDRDRWWVSPDVWDPGAAFQRAFGGEVHSWRRHVGTPVRLERREMPLLVTFVDLNDPLSAREVDPENLPAAFGLGVHLEAINIEVTHGGVTKGDVQKSLTWLRKADDSDPFGRLEAVSNGRATSLSQNLFLHHFSTGSR